MRIETGVGVVIVGYAEEKPALSPQPVRRAAAPPSRDEVASAIPKLMEGKYFSHNERLLCYGCGKKAPDAEWLRMRKFNVVAFDPHPDYGYNHLPDGPYHMVFLVFVLARMKTDENRRHQIAKAFARLRPGGLLAIVTRKWPKHVAEAGIEGDDALMRYIESLTGDLDVHRIVMPALDTDDNSTTVLVQRGGIFKPRQPYAWVDTYEGLAEAAAAIKAQGMVGLDVETTLDDNRVLCTVQMAIPGQTWIVDALALEDLAPLREIMEDEGIEKVIHNAMFEEEMLATRAIRIKNIFDTLPASRKKYKGKVEGGHKLGEVCERELGICIDKEMQTSDWTVRPLSDAQLCYAAVDAEVLVGLHGALKPPKLPENLSLFGDS